MLLENPLIVSLTSKSNLLTFTLSRALAAVCNVFWPNTTMPWLGKVANGLTLLEYNVSLTALLSFFSTLTTLVIPPLVNPAGANQGAAIESFLAYTPGITTDEGTQTFLPKLLFLTCEHGQ